MKTKTINIYQFDELNTRAKEAARAWWRAHVDTADYSAVLEDAVSMGAILGIGISSHRWTNSFKFSGSSPNIYWSGFGSQGDGACYEAFYSYRRGAVKAIRNETSDLELLYIAEQLYYVQRKAHFALVATTTHTGRYYNSGYISATVERSDGVEVTDRQEEAITDLLRRFANWIYSQLDAENDYSTATNR